MKKIPKPILLKNVNIIDGKENSEIFEHKDVLIENGKILEIGENLSFAGKCLDLSGKYLMPGLINLHTHLPASGKVSKKKLNDNKKLVKLILSNPIIKKIGVGICKKNVKNALYSGVTTVRAVGGVGDIDAILRDKINAGKCIGPRILSSNTAIGVIDGHMDGTVAKAVSTNEEAIALAKEQIDSGADFLKLMITGGILDTKERGKPGVLKMNCELVKAVSDYAHLNGKKVAAHVEGPEGMKVAIENGVDTIEHGASTDEELLLKLKEHGGALVLTISPAIPFVYLDPEVVGYGEAAQYNSKIFFESMLKNAENCLRLGVTIGLGTDTGCPYVTHYGFYRELVYFKRFVKGATAKLAIHLATEINAKIAGIENEVGTIEKGKNADLVVLDSNPFDNLEVIGNPIFVMKDGKIYRKKVKKFKKVEETLNSINF